MKISILPSSKGQLSKPMVYAKVVVTCTYIHYYVNPVALCAVLDNNRTLPKKDTTCLDTSSQVVANMHR